MDFIGLVLERTNHGTTDSFFIIDKKKFIHGMVSLVIILFFISIFVPNPYLC
jgi:hypothetical protein